MKLDIFSLSNEVLSCIKEECKKLNVNLTTTFRGSDHINDSDLYIVIAKKNLPTWESKPYCVWHYNHHTKSFSNGVLDVDSAYAIQNAAKRIHRGEYFSFKGC